MRVLVVGGGNSGAQILAELSLVADATWVTLDDPVFLPDDVDGRVLFERASARVRGDFSEAATTTLGDIVMVPPVKEARDRGVLQAVRPFARFTGNGVIWSDGTTAPSTPSSGAPAFARRPTTCGRSASSSRTAGSKGLAAALVREPRLWLAGYGNWTGAASATLIGAGRTARDLVPQIVAALDRKAASAHAGVPP